MSTTRTEWGVRVCGDDDRPDEFVNRPSLSWATAMLDAIRAPKHPRLTGTLIRRTITYGDWVEVPE